MQTPAAKKVQMSMRKQRQTGSTLYKYSSQKVPVKSKNNLGEGGSLTWDFQEKYQKNDQCEDYPTEERDWNNILRSHVSM